MIINQGYYTTEIECKNLMSTISLLKRIQNHFELSLKISQRTSAVKHHINEGSLQTLQVHK